MALSATTFDQILTGTAGDDSLTGGDGADWILGDGGNDTLNGGKGSDLLEGGAGDDKLYGVRGDDTLDGGDGNDLLDAGRGNAVLDGGAGDDLLIANLFSGASQTLSGGSGADTFQITQAVTGTGHVTITDFETGLDTLDLGTATVAGFAAGAGGIELTLGSGDGITLAGLSLWDGVQMFGAELAAGAVIGTAGEDRIFGTAGDDVTTGGEGDDLLTGEAGNDILIGGAGNDTLGGNQGNDTLDGGAGDDVIYGHKGNNLLLGGDGSDYISSGDQSSTIEGGTGDDVIELRMKAGGDHVASGGEGADEFVFSYLDARKQGDVTITDFEIGTDSLVIAGQSASDYLASHAGATLADTGEGALLTLAEGDTILFAGHSAAEMSDALFGLMA
ncbi:MAG: calcium-binding protein [Paenirhodobacter sp.]|uniref:calcium-binding protein n=1 Tax=Paenirhodobacter sp. TaxID=1965326 RepID=UPI003D142668